MSFNRLETSDFVQSSDAVSSTLWSTEIPALTTFFSSSAQIAGSSGKFYLSVYQTASNLTSAKKQFDIAYGNSLGSGSLTYNSTVNNISPTSTIYGQFQDLILGDENTNFTFGGVTVPEFFAITFERTRYKESILPGSLTLKLTSGSNNLFITDNSKIITVPQFIGSNKIYQLISGSAGNASGGIANYYTSNSGSYGWLVPDLGLILLNPRALASAPASGGINFVYSASSATMTPNISPNLSLFNAISGGASFIINSQETISSNYIFIRARSSEYNYSENPSFISGSTGEIIFNSFINAPRTYITTVGLYNDTNELLAVAKLSRPLPKDFTKEALIRVKLDF
jgi:hypothetical protein